MKLDANSCLHINMCIKVNKNVYHVKIDTKYKGKYLILHAKWYNII